MDARISRELADFLARTRRTLALCRTGLEGHAVRVRDLGPGFAAWCETDDGGATPTTSSDRVFWLSPGRAITREDIHGAIGHYRGLGRCRAFFTVHPECWSDALAPGFSDGRLTRWPDVRFHVLARETAERASETWRESDLTLRVLRAEDIAAVDAVLGAIAPWYGELWLPVLRRAIVDHGAELHVAYARASGSSDGPIPVAIGGLMVDGGWCYIGFAATDPAHRGRGGQTILLRSRLASARARGAAWCVGETNSMAAQSLRNFTRCGFEPALEWGIWGWEDGAP